MTAITPGTHLVVGEPFTETIPAGTPFISFSESLPPTIITDWHSDAHPIDGGFTRHRLTVEAPVPTPDEFQPGTVAWVRFENPLRSVFHAPTGNLILPGDMRVLLGDGTARLTHVPTPPAMTREQAEQIVADASDDVRAAVEVLRGGGEA